MKADKVKCRCGDMITPGNQDRHEKGWWHRNFEKCWELHDRGLTFAEIGRQLGATRVYVRVKMDQGRPAQVAA